MNNEWLFGDEKELRYHLSQYDSPKAYTLEIADLANRLGLFKSGNRYIDAACGCGAVTAYLKKTFPTSQFIGIDLNQQYIKIASEACVLNRYICGDLLNISNYQCGDLKGIICLQTISWLKEYEFAMEAFYKTSADWILVTSLFYEGPVDAEIVVTDWSKSVSGVPGRRSNYNIYSLDRFIKHANKNNYDVKECERFEIPFDLDPPSDGGMATFTTRDERGRRLQMSGPLLMPWYTVVLKKKCT